MVEFDSTVSYHIFVVTLNKHNFATTNSLVSVDCYIYRVSFFNVVLLAMLS